MLSVSARLGYPRLALFATLALFSWIAATARWGPDWPAQEYRAGLARTSGLVLWDDNWYAGHALAGYSVLSPVLSAVLGAAVTGVAACLLCTWSSAQLVRSPHVWIYLVRLAGVVVTLADYLLIGQVPFLLGAAFGVAAIVAHTRDRAWLVAVLAAVGSLSSPLAGSFLLLAAAALAAVAPWRRVLPFATAFVGPAVAATLGGASGPMPYPWTSLACVLAFCAGVLILASGDDAAVAVLRRFTLVYAIAAVVLFAVPNPIGGNVTRVGRLTAAPIACYILTRPRRRRALTAVVAATLAPTTAWSLLPVLVFAGGAGDPSRHTTYYTGMLGFLQSHNPADGRLEIPFTKDHWETRWVAPMFPLARGWERQTDLQYNAVLYRPLTADSYHTWLEDTAVRYIALPDVPLDAGGTSERTVLQHPPSYLTPVWHDAHWHVWRVSGTPPLATGAVISDLDPASFKATFAAAGEAVVHIRASSLWTVTAGVGCVSATAEGWLRITTPAAGTVSVAARLNTRILSGKAARCQTAVPGG